MNVNVTRAGEEMVHELRVQGRTKVTRRTVGDINLQGCGNAAREWGVHRPPQVWEAMV